MPFSLLSKFGPHLWMCHILIHFRTLAHNVLSSWNVLSSLFYRPLDLSSNATLCKGSSQASSLYKPHDTLYFLKALLQLWQTSFMLQGKWSQNLSGLKQQRFHILTSRLPTFSYSSYIQDTVGLRRLVIWLPRLMKWVLTNLNTGIAMLRRKALYFLSLGN